MASMHCKTLEHGAIVTVCDTPFSPWLEQVQKCSKLSALVVLMLPFHMVTLYDHHLLDAEV